MASLATGVKGLSGKRTRAICQETDSGDHQLNAYNNRCATHAIFHIFQLALVFQGLCASSTNTNDSNRLDFDLYTKFNNSLDFGYTLYWSRWLYTSRNKLKYILLSWWDTTRIDNGKAVVLRSKCSSRQHKVNCGSTIMEQQQEQGSRPPRSYVSVFVWDYARFLEKLSAQARRPWVAAAEQIDRYTQARGITVHRRLCVPFCHTLSRYHKLEALTDTHILFTFYIYRRGGGALMCVDSIFVNCEFFIIIAIVVLLAMHAEKRKAPIRMFRITSASC